MATAGAAVLVWKSAMRSKGVTATAPTALPVVLAPDMVKVRAVGAPLRYKVKVLDSAPPGATVNLANICVTVAVSPVITEVVSKLLV